MKYIILILALISCENTVIEYKELPVPVVDYSAEVVISDVKDGDTYSFNWRDEEWDIRLLNVDCFETRNGSRLQAQADQYGITTDSAKALGLEAKQLMIDLILDQKVTIERDSLKPNFDSFGRLLRHVKINNINFKDTLENRGLTVNN